MLSRILGFFAALFLASSIVLGSWWVSELSANAKLRQQLETANLQVKQSSEQAKKDSEVATSNYDSLASSCRDSIRSAVYASRVKVVEVPRYVKDGSPNPVCPTVSLRDIQGASNTTLDVSPSGNGNGAP